jgi:gamma-glutamylcyclotransferase (GGCT)/AIG2-like uncharacterized protein YtfP
MTVKPWQQQRVQRHQGIQIADPKADVHPSIYDDSWNDEDTQPGMGTVVSPKQEKHMSAKPKEMERTNLMFVFGRYRQGFNLNLVVARDKGFRGVTRTEPKFKMLNIGDEFPIIISEGKTSIIGEVYEIELRTFDFMDKLEECPSTQGREIVSLENGLRAHMYVIPKLKAPQREEEIPSGDWIEWKRSERTREKDKKEKFLSMMAKGKAEAARRRVLEEEEQAAIAAAQREEWRARIKAAGNPTDHPGRLWDPIRGKWETVPPSNDVKVQRDVTLYSGKNGKKTIHVSDVDMSSLRARLEYDGHIVPLSDASVRAKSMALYGMWFEVD